MYPHHCFLALCGYLCSTSLTCYRVLIFYMTTPCHTTEIVPKETMSYRSRRFIICLHLWQFSSEWSMTWCSHQDSRRSVQANSLMFTLCKCFHKWNSSLVQVSNTFNFDISLYAENFLICECPLWEKKWSQNGSTLGAVLVCNSAPSVALF